MLLLSDSLTVTPDVGKSIIVQIIAIIGAFIIGCISIYSAYKQYKIKTKKERKEDTNLDRLEEFQQLFETSSVIDALKDIKYSRVYDTAAILVAHNSGGPIGFQYLTKTSILFDQAIEHSFDVKSNFVNVTLDQSFWEMLLSLIKNKTITIKNKQLNDGLLKNIFDLLNLEEGKFIYLSHIYTEEFNMKKVSYIYYLFLGTKTKDFITKPKSNKELFLVTNAINKIKLYYTKYFNNTIVL